MVPHLVTEIPGPKAREHIAFDQAWTSPSLPRAYGLVPVRGDGASVEDIDGNVFLDFTAGIAVSSTGYNHPRVSAAVHHQVDQLLHFSASDFYLPIYAKTAAELGRISPIGGRTRTYLGNSGAEVVEAAMKLARHTTGRQHIVAFLGAFHGRTYGAVSLTASKAKYHEGFGPLLPGVHHVPFGSAGLDELEDRLFKRLVPPREVAAIFVEPIQGEGGYVVPDSAFLPRLREICDRHGILLVADEIQSGAGRTGKMWAIQHWDVEPDIVLAAKGIASGMPLGAMTTRDELMTWQIGHHGSTFGGNPVSCAAALATIELLEEGLIDNAHLRGEQAFDGLRPLNADYSCSRRARMSFGCHRRSPSPRARCPRRSGCSRQLWPTSRRTACRSYVMRSAPAPSTRCRPPAEPSLAAAKARSCPRPARSRRCATPSLTSSMTATPSPSRGSRISSRSRPAMRSSASGSAT
jgi:4-aminobutyrate aminotransferase